MFTLSTIYFAKPFIIYMEVWLKLARPVLIFHEKSRKEEAVDEILNNEDLPDEY